MFRVKICGVTRINDVAACIAAGADALGFNFYPQSPRFVDAMLAERLADAVDRAAPAGAVDRVGVFVNGSPQFVAEMVLRARLSWVQLHGDEPPEAPAEIAAICATPVKIVRAVRVNSGQGEVLARTVEEAHAAGRALDAILVDAAAPDAYGGTGRTAPWDEIVRVRSALGGLPLVLAGGLRPENVADAIRAVRPDSVDTASGVESAPGVKDARLASLFVEAARGAFDRC